jgi:K+-transporting ATPase ATPase C chain
VMGIIRQQLTALRFLLVISILLGIVYPTALFLFGQVVAKAPADGSFVTVNSQVIGSTLIGQDFPGEKWFHSRPSAAGADGYDALSSAATNAGPNEISLSEAIRARRSAFATSENVWPSKVPADALTASASGLDPDISPENAYLQAPRIAQARHLSSSEVNSLIKRHVKPRLFGFLGEPRVNVLELNIELNSLK